MTDNLQGLIAGKTGLKLGVNKINELSRLVYEISRREDVSFETILTAKKIEKIIAAESTGYLAKFAALKKYLIERRYPNALKENGFEAYFSRMKSPDSPVKTYNRKFYPENIFIERAAEKSPLAERVRKLSPEINCRVIESLKSYRKNNPALPFDPKKRNLIVAVEKWDFVKPCPCTKNVVNCGYNVINLGFGCPYDCSYCYLQQYSNSRGIVLTANLEDYFPVIETYLKKCNDKKIRIGTGEFTDSLALDYITGHAKQLIEFFAHQNAVLELKTKSANINGLISLEHKGNTVISWSLSPHRIAAVEELGAASVAERLAAAKACADAGYGVGFHFDPIIHYEGWEKDYEQLVNDMFDAVSKPEWISLGALRFYRELKGVIEARFPGSGYIYGELSLGADKKMRYYKSLRNEIFSKMTGWIKKRNDSSEVYLCMEGPDMWQETLGRTKLDFFKDKN